MKYRDLLTVVMVGVAFVTPIARGGPIGSPNAGPAGPKSYGDSLGPDITKNTWQGWQAPAATVNPEVLIPADDSAGSNSAGGLAVVPLATLHTNSSQLGTLFNQGDAKREGAKPIEEIEASATSPVFNEPAASSSARAPKSHETKRILMIAVISLAILAYRKFRRSTVGPTQKPSFL